jgi:flotillin
VGRIDGLSAAKELVMFSFSFPLQIAAVGVLMFAAVVFLLSSIARVFRKAGPHQAVIVYGFRGPRVIKGRGTFVVPMFENYRELSLELMSFDVAPQQDLYTMQGVAVTVEAVAQIKVKSDPESIQTAAEQFLTKTDQNREALIRLVMEGHLRGIIGQLTVEQIVKEPEMVGDRMRNTCAADMNKMGLEVISFTIKEVRDKNEYISNMGRPDIARIQRDADVATAEAERDTAIRRAVAQRESAVAKAQADQERVLAETLSMTKQAEAQRDLEIKKAEYLETTKRQQAQADKAYEIQTNVMQQQVVAEQVKVHQIEKEHEILVQDAEIQRRERELIATVLKGAEIERRRIETLASAERQRLISEAEGRASAIRVQGEAEAEIVFKKGEAEARAMNVKAEAYQEYNQAAVIDKLISSMPEIVRALAAPLQNVDKITVISTGGDTAGMNKITGDLTKMAAQIPALFETLSGMQMSELFSKVRTIGDHAPRPDSNPDDGPKSKAAGQS